MVDKVQFMETLQSVSEIVKSSAQPMSQEEILRYFDDMELTAPQKAMVADYFQNPEMLEASKDNQTDDNQTEEMEDSISPVLQMYLDDIYALPVFTEQEETDCYQKLIQGDASVLKSLSDCWLPRVLEIARKHTSKKAALEDLIQEGNMGLFLKLQELLGSEESVEFEAVISAAAEAAMWAYIQEIGAEDDGDSSVVGKVTLVQEAKKLLDEQLERESTLKELADYTKMDEDELQGILDLVEKANRP